MIQKNHQALETERVIKELLSNDTINLWGHMRETSFLQEIAIVLSMVVWHSQELV
jgi:hypothetical protein